MKRYFEISKVTSTTIFTTNFKTVELVWPWFLYQSTNLLITINKFLSQAVVKFIMSLNLLF